MNPHPDEPARRANVGDSIRRHGASPAWVMALLLTGGGYTAVQHNDLAKAQTDASISRQEADKLTALRNRAEDKAAEAQRRYDDVSQHCFDMRLQDLRDQINRTQQGR